MTTLSHRIAVILGAIALGAAALASTPTPPEELEFEYAAQLAELRTELASIEREIEQCVKEHSVAERVIELAAADLEDVDDEREKRKLVRIIAQYRDRVARTERDRAELEDHRVHLIEAMEVLERRYEGARGNSKARERDEARSEREERIRELRRSLDESHVPRDAETEDRAAVRERQVAINQIEALRLALPAFVEADDRHAAERLEIAIRLRELKLEGRRGDEVRELGRRAPNREELRELLGLASELWREFGHDERAETIVRMTETLWSDSPWRERRRPDARGGDQREMLIDRIERLQGQLEHIHEMIEAMHDELEEVKKAVGY